MKKNTLKTKIIAGVLSAITVCSVGAMTATTAFAAETQVSTDTSITETQKISMSKDAETITKMVSGTLLKVLDSTEYGKFLTPALQSLLDAFIEQTDERVEKKVDELNEKVDKLFNKVAESEASIKAEITNDLGVQSFYNTFMKFKTQTQAIHQKIKEIYAGNLSDADKAAKIGSLTGTYTEWRDKFEDVLNELNGFCQKPSMTKDGNIFELTYNHYTNSVMFSGEALDKAKPVCNHVMQVYAAGCATLVESLTAQLYYNNLPAAAKAAVNPEFAAHICKDNKDINNEIKTVTKLLTGAEKGNKADTLKGMYDKVMGTSRSVLVNKGHDNIQLLVELKLHNHQSKYADGTYNDTKGKNVADEFNTEFNNKALDVEKAKAIADYAREKGVTVRKLLEANGFNVSKLPQNVTLVTAKAWDDSVSTLSRLGGYNYQKAFYKGVNVDAKGAGDANVQLLDCGYNSWNFSTWGYMLKGMAAILMVK